MSVGFVMIPIFVICFSPTPVFIITPFLLIGSAVFPDPSMSCPSMSCLFRNRKWIHSMKRASRSRSKKDDGKKQNICQPRSDHSDTPSHREKNTAGDADTTVVGCSPLHLSSLPIFSLSSCCASSLYHWHFISSCSLHCVCSLPSSPFQIPILGNDLDSPSAHSLSLNSLSRITLFSAFPLSSRSLSCDSCNLFLILRNLKFMDLSLFFHIPYAWVSFSSPTMT